MTTTKHTARKTGYQLYEYRGYTINGWFRAMGSYTVWCIYEGSIKPGIHDEVTKQLDTLRAAKAWIDQYGSME